MNYLRRVIRRDWGIKDRKRYFFFQIFTCFEFAKIGKRKSIWIIKNAKGSGKESRNFGGNDKFGIEFERIRVTATSF